MVDISMKVYSLFFRSLIVAINLGGCFLPSARAETPPSQSPAQAETPSSQPSAPYMEDIDENRPEVRPHIAYQFNISPNALGGRALVPEQGTNSAYGFKFMAEY